MLIQTVRVSKLSGGAKYCWNVKPMQQRYRQTTDRRQTDGSCHKANVT